jgi:hypothetical protein
VKRLAPLAESAITFTCFTSAKVLCFTSSKVQILTPEKLVLV